MDPKEVRHDYVDLNYLAQDRAQWWNLLNKKLIFLIEI